MLKKLTYLKFKKLQTIAGEGLVTAYIPLIQGSAGHKQNKSQFHALRAELKKHLPSEQHVVLSNVLESVLHMLGYINSSSGLLVAMRGAEISVFSLPFTPVLAWHKNSTYHLQQVKEYFATNSPFYVLAISKKGSHLFKGDKTKLTHVAVSEIGQDVKTLLRIDEGQSDSLQNHSEGAGRGGTTQGFHGHGGVKDVKKKLFEAYLRAVDKKIMSAIDDKKVPLVLVAVGHGQSMYRHVSKYPNIALKSLTTNPDDISTEDLHSRIVPLMY